MDKTPQNICSDFLGQLKMYLLDKIGLRTHKQFPVGQNSLPKTLIFSNIISFSEHIPKFQEGNPLRTDI